MEAKSTGRFCFVHAADLHLDTPFEGFGAVAPEIRAALRDASLKAWDALVALAIEREAAFLLLAGDIYDGAERGVRAQLRFVEGLRRLSSAGVSVFVVHGNHDPGEEGWSAIREWPEGVCVFGSDEVGALPVEVGGRRLATVYGLSYARAETRENLALRYRRGDGPGIHIGLLHCNLGGRGDHADYSPCTAEDLDAAGMDYWALGHIHAQSIERRGRSWIVYPGNLQGRSPKPSERGPKGAVVVEVDGDSVSRVEPVALDRVRFAELRCDVSGLADLAALRDELAAGAREAREEHAGRALVLRAELSGRSALHRDLARVDALPDLLATLREESRNLRPFLWWSGVRDRTANEIDRRAILARDDFSAELCRRVDALAASDALDSFLSEPLGPLEGFRAPPLPEPDEGLLRGAEGRALDALERESDE